MVCLRDLNFNGGSLRFQVILEFDIRFPLRNFAFYGMPSGSGIQRWLVAIYTHSGNRNQVIFKKIYIFGMPAGSEIEWGLVAI